MLLIEIPPVEIVPTDFWGIVMPAWVGAAGTIFAAVIGVVALIRGQRTQGGLKEVQRGLNEPEASSVATAHAPTVSGDATVTPPTANMSVEAHAPTVSTRSESADVDDRVGVTDTVTVKLTQGIRWTLREGSRSKRYLRNNSDVDAIVTGFRQIDGGDDAILRVDLPTIVGPGVELPFSIDRSLASPAVIAVEVTWTLPDSTVEQSRVFFA